MVSGPKKRGRKKGVPNKATIERRRIALEKIGKAKRDSYDEIKEIADYFKGVAAREQRKVPVVTKGKDGEEIVVGGPDLKVIEHNLKLAGEHFNMLTKYDRPTLQSVRHGGDTDNETPIPIRLDSLSTMQLTQLIERIGAAIAGRG